MTDAPQDPEYRRYLRTNVAEMADWQPDLNMDGVSISDADRDAGSPKPGDKIARNPENHADRWLVSAEYFEDNFTPLESTPQNPRVEVHKAVTDAQRQVLRRVKDETWLRMALDRPSDATGAVVEIFEELRADLLSRLDAVGEPVAEGFIGKGAFGALSEGHDHTVVWSPIRQEGFTEIPVVLYRRQGGEDG